MTTPICIFEHSCVYSQAGSVKTGAQHGVESSHYLILNRAVNYTVKKVLMGGSKVNQKLHKQYGLILSIFWTQCISLLGYRTGSLIRTAQRIRKQIKNSM